MCTNIHGSLEPIIQTLALPSIITFGTSGMTVESSMPQADLLTGLNSSGMLAFKTVVELYCVLWLCDEILI